MKVYQKLACKLAAIENCDEAGNTVWRDIHQYEVDKTMKLFPSGSGFDSGTELDSDSTAEKLIFNTAFHHLDEHGYYCGWTEHKVTVTPSLQFGFNIKISGKNKNDIKGYIADCFCEILGGDL